MAGMGDMANQMESENGGWVLQIGNVQRENDELPIWGYAIYRQSKLFAIPFILMGNSNMTNRFSNLLPVLKHSIGLSPMFK